MTESLTKPRIKFGLVMLIKITALEFDHLGLASLRCPLLIIFKQEASINVSNHPSRGENASASPIASGERSMLKAAALRILVGILS